MRSTKTGGRGPSSTRPARPAPASVVADLMRQLRAQQESFESQSRKLEEVQGDLSRALSRYADLYESLPVPYCTLDVFGVVVDLNATFEKFVGRRAKHCVGRPLMRMVAESDRSSVFGHMRRCRSEGSARTSVDLVRGGSVVPVDLISHAVPKGVEESARFRTAVIDLSERRQAEEAGAVAERERRRAETREAAVRATGEVRDRFLAELSHELRTPLTPILATVDTLRRRDDLPESLRGSLEVVRRNVEVEARLIDDLLDVSRIRGDRVSLQLAPLDAHRVLREVVANLGSEIERCEVVFKLELGARACWVLGDELRLNQILWNLVVNALRATPARGEIVVSTANIADDLRIIVRDSGVGIEPKRLGEIFSPFSKDAPEGRGKGGLGLGLAIVKGLVEAHQGRIQVFSEGKGMGSAFVVELPSIAEPHAADEEPSGEPRERPVRPDPGIRVLLVEDHADTRAAMETLLKMNGLVVSSAEDIPSALAEAGKGFDILVCDIGLPNGSGLDVIRQLSEERPVKAIALSGYGSPRDRELAAQAGFSLHLTKPVGAERLLEAIVDLVGRREATRGSESGSKRAVRSRSRRSRG